MRHHVLSAGLLVAVITLAGFPLKPVVALDSDPTWGPRETVWNSGNPTLHEGTDRFLAYDHHGVPGIACAVSVGGYINLWRRVPNLGWSTRTSMGMTSAQCPTHAYDRHEHPAVCYVDPDNTQVMFAAWDGSQWSHDGVVTTTGQYAAMAYDLYGRPAIAYTTMADQEVRFISDTDGDGDWTDETSSHIFSFTGDYGEVRLAFDPLNRPVVAFWASGGGDNKTIYVWAREGSAWYWVEVDYSATPELSLSLAVEPETGFAGLAYADSKGTLTYAQWDGDQWQSEVLGEGLTPSLAFDPEDGAPVIACTDPKEFLNLYYWDSDDDQWASDVVDGEIGVGLNPSLAFNPYGDDPFGIAYFDGSGNVYYIQDPPVVPEPATLGLLSAGLGVLALRRRRSARRR